MEVNMITLNLENPGDLSWRVKKAVASIYQLLYATCGALSSVRKTPDDIEEVAHVNIDRLEDDLVSVTVVCFHSIVGNLVFKYYPDANRWAITSVSQYTKLYYNLKDFLCIVSLLDELHEHALVVVSADNHCSYN